MVLKTRKNVLFLLILLVFVSLGGSIVYSALSVTVTIQAGGTISLSSVLAESGSATDIESAIDYAVNHGITNVHIPAGIYDFVPVGQSWRVVRIPDGISLFGEPTVRDANGQVISWGTILRMPFEAPESSYFFYVYGTTGTRISDIEFMGYREINENSGAHYSAIKVTNSQDFRFDHLYILNIAGTSIMTSNSNGVIDHCKFVNNKNVYVTALYHDCTVFYGVGVSGDGQTWETNIKDVLGHYTSRTVFIEDNYFEGWRHCVSSNQRAHYVFRYNTERDNGYGSIDGHGREGSGSGEGTRAIECYGNDFAEPTWGDMGVQLRGGGGVFFDNIVTGYGLTGTSISQYNAFVCMIQYTPDSYPDQQIKDVWIWDNTLTPSNADLWDAAWGGISQTAIEENEEFFLHAPNQSVNGFTYTPYTYPHPLVTD